MGAPERRKLGAGWVYRGYELGAALHDRDIAPDWRWSAVGSDAPLRVLHRTLPDGELYFVSNPAARAMSGQLSVRVSGRTPQLWYADSGLRSPASYRIDAGRTELPLALAAHAAVFVVLRGHAASNAWTPPPSPPPQELQTLGGPWRVQFQAGRGAPDSARFDSLQSWSDSDQSGIRYFSGTARYSKGFSLPQGWQVGARIWLNLGDVRDIVTVTVNVGLLERYGILPIESTSRLI